MNYDEILDFHNMDELNIMRRFCTKAIEIADRNFGNMILELPQEAREIIADLIKRNCELEEEIEMMHKDNLIAEKLITQALGKR